MNELPLRLTVDEVAKYLCCAESTVRTAASSGELRGAKIGEDWIFLASDVDAYFQLRIEQQQTRIAEKRSRRSASCKQGGPHPPPSLEVV